MGSVTNTDVPVDSDKYCVTCMFFVIVDVMFSSFGIKLLKELSKVVSGGALSVKEPDSLKTDEEKDVTTDTLRSLVEEFGGEAAREINGEKLDEGFHVVVGLVETAGVEELKSRY